MRTTVAIALALLLMPACVEDDGDGSADSGETDAQIQDQGPRLADVRLPDEGARPDEGVLADIGPGADAGPPPDPDDGVPPDGSVPDAADMGPVSVGSCQDLCDRFAACGQLAEAFGDEQACLAVCGRLDGLGQQRQWFGCAEMVSCEELRLFCRPPAPPPLGCDRVCELVTSCEVDNPFSDCPAACEEGAEETTAAFQACGERLFDGCDVERFLSCLASDVYESCDTLCTRADECNLGLGAQCPLDCIAGLTQPDPLARIRSQETGQCVRLALDDCVRVDECFNPDGPPPVVDMAGFCQLYNRCNFEFAEPCDSFYGQIRDRLGEEAVQCAAAQMRRACPEFEWELLEACEGGGRPMGPSCPELCLARDACGLLPADEDRPGCNASCLATERMDPEGWLRLQALFPCGEAPDCPALESCLAVNDPAISCVNHCAALVACGLDPAEAAACEATCDERFERPRHGAWRTCVLAAGDDCDAVAACAPAALPDCDRACARLGPAACDLPDQGGCLVSCDDRHFEAPVDVAAEVACVLTAPSCPAAAACREEAEPAVRGCLNYCRATSTACDEAADRSLETCVIACGAGLSSEDALRYLSAEACLEALGARPACDDLAGCLEGAEPGQVDCAALCDRSDACEVPNPACVADCQAAPDAIVAACVAEADRTNLGCGAIADCVGYQPPPASPECVALCDLQHRCDGATDVFLCERGCTPAPAELPVRLACAQITHCPSLGDCLNLPGDPNPACDASCLAANACGAFPEGGPSCADHCAGRLASPRTDAAFADGLAACVADAGGAMCPDPAEVLICFEPPAFECALTEDIFEIPAAGGRFQVNTADNQDLYSGSCDRSGKEQVLGLALDRRANVTFRTVGNQYDTLIWARSVCDDPASELGCNDDFQGLNSQLILNGLEPGIYYLFVDGFGDAEGVTDVVIEINPI